MSAIDRTYNGASPTTPTDALDQTHVGTEMSTGVVNCAPGETAWALAARMANHRSHAVVIAGIWDDGGPTELRWGLISHTEVVRALADGRFDQLAADMEPGRVVTCDPHESMLEAARRMQRHGVDHLVVAEGDEPVGVISTLDVMRVASSWAS